MMYSWGENSIDISIDFGVTYRFLRNQVIQSHWIESTDQLVLLLKRNILEIWEINSTGYNKLYTTNNVKTYFIEKDKLIIIFMESNVEAQLSIWESPTKTILTSFFPKLLVIKDIYNVNILHKNVYVTLLNSHDLNCLYTSEYKNLKFVKKICSLSKSSATGNCPAYVHPNLEGVLYANLIDDDSKVSSSFSANNGRSWIKMDFKSSTSECEMKKCKFILNLPCDPKYGSIKGNGRINIKSGHLYYDDEILSTTFISFDGGKTWKYTPSIDFQPLILNRGGNVIFFKKQSKNIYFSFDEGNSWKYFQLFPENQLILYSSSGGINKDEFSNVVTSNGANIFFNIIKFSNIFNRPCQTSDYINWIPERVHGTCFQGKETVYVMKKTNSLCVDSFSSEREAAHSPCHCTIDDFDCRFNYYTVDGLCVLDPDSGITEEPQHCKPGSHYVSHIAGYIKLSDNDCDSHDIDGDLSNFHQEFCIADGNLLKNNIFIELENFLMLVSDDNIYISKLKSDGSSFSQSFFEQIYSKPHNIFSFPIAFDYKNEIIYYSNESFIYRAKHLKDPSRAEITQIYSLDNKIRSMTYDITTNSLIYLDHRDNLWIRDLNTNYLVWVLTSVSHRADKSLVVTSFYIAMPDSDLKEPILILNNVDSFGVINKNLYFLQSDKLSHVKITNPKRITTLSTNSKYKSVIAHEHNIEYTRHDCKSLGCNITCIPGNYPYDPDKCYCPQDSLLNQDQKCVCEPNKEKCLEIYCEQFYCQNAKCLHDNVRCNSIDDCGDKSDESNCSKICEPEFHLCEEKCYPKHLLCHPDNKYVFEPEVIEKEPEEAEQKLPQPAVKLPGTSIETTKKRWHYYLMFISLFGIFLVMVLFIAETKFGIYKNFKQNIIQTRPRIIYSFEDIDSIIEV
ncbi:hypothetical protein HZS_7619 [Henneguya salminicola]|nr:hypothetical protein HZS_7619 [Henneguya salminicola]